MELLKKLRSLEGNGTPIRVGLVGCGQMGSGLVHVIEKIPGMRTAAIADINIERPKSTLEQLGVSHSNVVTTTRLNEAEVGLAHGKIVLSEQATLLPGLEHLDVLVEATGNPEIGASIAFQCINQKKHVVMLNVETDVTVGYILHKLAEKAGCVYSVASGDEPAVCKMLFDFSCSLGFEVICLGKGKNNPIDIYATPESCLKEAAAKNMNPQMLASFKDGTKTMVEMAAVSNATGLIPDIPGMHGLEVGYKDLLQVFVPKIDGGVLSQAGRVDYSTGAIAPGVFAIVRTDEPRIQSDMRFVSMGQGPYYLFVRPFHLCNIETPLSIAEAFLYREATVFADCWASEVISVAKRDIRRGEKIGEIGSQDIYHRIYTAQEARNLKAISMGIAPGATAKEDIPCGQILTQENTSPDAGRFIYGLRQMQDEMLYSPQGRPEQP